MSIKKQEEKMNKIELIAAVSDKSGLTKKDSEKTIDAFVAAVTEALEREDKVQLIGFGSFEVKRREAREGINPKTQERITIAAAKTPVFRPGKGLKDKVDKK